MKIKTSEATPLQLNWLVAKIEGIKLCLAPFPKAKNFVMVGYSTKGEFPTPHEYLPTTSWSQGGPIIEREGLSVSKYATSADAEIGKEWFSATLNSDFNDLVEGPTPLIAAMRCFVTSKLGDEVDVPDELC